MRFHVLGIGSIGTLISHHLRQTNPDSPISLIVKRARKFPSTRQYPTGKYLDQAIRLSVTNNGHTTSSTNFDQEVTDTKRLPPPTEDPDGHYGPIKSLIVCLKTPATVQALSQLKHRIGPDSVIALLQNGMGVYDELCSQIWPKAATRPFFILGTTTHGVTTTEKQGEVIHMSKPGAGDIKWGLVPDPRKEVDLEGWVYGMKLSTTSVLSPPDSPLLPLSPPPESNTDLSNLHQTLTALLSLTSLNSTLLPIPTLHHTLLLKVALNATINPLTAIIGAGSLPNGSLIGSSPSHRLIRMLSAETSAIITAYLDSLHAPNLPPPDAVRLFAPEALTSRTLALCQATSGNTSSMAADAKAARMTEIDHINGYLIQLADRHNIPSPHHKMLREMVKFTTEVTGLRKDTSLGTRTRITRRSTEIEDQVKDVQTQRLLLEKKNSERQLRRDLAKAREELTKARSERRKGRSAKRLELQDSVEHSSDPELVKANKDARRTKRNFAQAPPVEDQDKRDMLAHLDELKESVLAPESQESQDKLQSDEKTVEPSQEEQDAIKAIEDRILTGSGFGRRRF